MASFSMEWLGDEVTYRLSREDGLIENLGAFFFLTAAGLFLASYFQSSGPGKGMVTLRSKKNISYLLLAILFFVGFGEEISWGQRIIGWETPQFMQEINRQRETTLHNINIFNSDFFYKGNSRTVERPFLSIMLDVQTWFFLFWFSYCLILPIANKYSLATRRHISRFGLPVPPLWIGFLLLTNFLIFISPLVFYYLIDSRPSRMFHAFSEIRESNEAFVFAVLALHELKKQLSKKREGL